jgi:hypothetical protein
VGVVADEGEDNNMEQIIEKSKRLLKTNPIIWAMPLIEDMESYHKHSAIEWAIKLIEYCVVKSEHGLTQTFVGWIGLLKEVVYGKKIISPEKLGVLSQEIFNFPPERTSYQIFIAHLYAIEGGFIIERYDLYTKKLVYVMDWLNEWGSEYIDKAFELYLEMKGK